ncbi:metallophosphoesterase domain protein [Natronomonas pharaonis DSM 2160]|uniref:Metallophosphoesterase domain protein n=1 Tax=Natronomonas pharaonis (strain ATCC 35678 / DSM 2160 / CIP 103997 / JCM 8858 / NBRC 14720 / NCIMB 2260 / Gabara) TaxID=348780 RepID=A0A1U7EY42_NATPD|nr:metallophosphoesterase family protein [Natronomonas pharaonis]CAI50125.1 metallophosphoesterase domain protein [Natronomonas pharaonis DSM 2160]
MSRYLIADLHLDHAEVLEYTDRPFASVAEMNRRLVDGWNATVADSDEVVFVGDFAIPSEPTTIRRWVRRLAGDITFVVGDHDAGLHRSHGLDVRQEYRFSAGGYRFRCIHDPDDVDDRGTDWLIHGHHHDMRPDEYPFVTPDSRRINVSVELLDYEPLAVEELVDYLDRRQRLRKRP